MAVDATRGMMRKTEVVLLLGIGVAAGWLVVDSSPVTRTLESAPIDIPKNPLSESSSESPAGKGSEPQTLLARTAALRMLPDRAERDGEKEKSPRSRSLRRDGGPLRDGSETPSESDGPPGSVSSAQSSGGTTTTGGTGSSGGSSGGSAGVAGGIDGGPGGGGGHSGGGSGVGGGGGGGFGGGGGSGS